MKVTAIIKDVSPCFFTGWGTPGGPMEIVGFDTKTNEEKLRYVLKNDLGKSVTAKIERGAFRDQVELNMLMRGPVEVTYKLEPRRGYKLATFEITKGKQDV